MAGKRITSLNTLTGANTATIDVLPIVDVSAGEAKQITTQELSNALVTINGGLQGGFGVYTNTTLGLANTANGGYFFVPSANTGESLSMYQDVGGTAVYITGIPEFNTSEFPYGGLSRQNDTNITTAFVYDTRNDSDGGEWRKKCQHTSWYNEPLNTATRGSRREFPEKVLIFCDVSKLYIYDLDSGIPILWLSTTSNTIIPYSGSTRPISCVSAMNGFIYIGSNNNGNSGGMTVIDFIKDEAYVRLNTFNKYWPRPISERNAGSSGFPTPAIFLYPLVDRDINSIAMDVRPGTPPNKERLDLPNPTIAVGTNGGVSIIHWDNRIADITWSSYGIVGGVSFRPSDKALCIRIDSATAGRYRHIYHQLPVNDISNGVGYIKGNADEYYPMYAGYTGTSIPLNALGSLGSVFFNGKYDGGLGSGGQLTSFIPEPSKPENGAICVLKNTHNTGFMPGNTILSLTESTYNTTFLVESGELVINGDFATDITGWIDYSEGTGSISWNASGYIDLTTGIDADNEGRAYQTIPTIIGESYVVEIVKASGHSRVDVSFSPAGAELGFLSGTVSGYIPFVATHTTTYINLRNVSNTSGTSSIASVSARRVVGDRSVWQTPVNIKGNVSRTSVATGSELVGYSGFSSNNYIQVPYNGGAFEIGTGDFFVSLWFNQTTAASRTIMEYQIAGGPNTNGKWFISLSSGQSAAFYAYSNTGGLTIVTASPSTSYGLGVWNNIVAVKRGETAELYLNGELTSTDTSATANFSTDGIANSSITIGVRQDLASALEGSMSQIRISKTVPSPEIIREMYEQERILYQANTKAIIPSTAHTMLSYDNEYDVVYSVTPSGSYIVKGIQVLDKIIDNNLVYTGITASGNITSKWTTTGANTYIPSIYPMRSEINKTPRKTYDRKKVKTKTYTTDATPKVIYHIPFDEGEEGTFITRTIGVNREDGTQIGSYEHRYTARRVNGSENVALIGSTNTVIQEVTSSMDVTVSNGNNYITLTYTGLASNTIEWTSYTEGTFNDF